MRNVLAVLTATLLAQTVAAQAPAAGAARAEARAAAASNPGNELECLVEPHMVVNVGSSVDGVLEQVLVNRGDQVRRGQVVARLQSGVEAAAAKLSEARVEFARRKLERSKSLVDKQLISTQEMDELATEVKLREEELRKDEETLKLRTIVSPIDGVVVERRLTPGEFIRTDKSVVLRLAQIDPLNIEVIAPARMFRTVQVGMSGRVSLAPMFPGSHAAKVVVVDKVVDAASGTLGVRLQLPNPENRIPAGIKCSVVIGR
ncbi:MAG: efflux RND transporter periplasmic adaptor subunit [Burkholderiales bacterium]|nr:efflux RND transporter periplasmic adaptor subunit [Burkholderiales bacterium]